MLAAAAASAADTRGGGEARRCLSGGDASNNDRPREKSPPLGEAAAAKDADFDTAAAPAGVKEMGGGRSSPARPRGCAGLAKGWEDGAAVEAVVAAATAAGVAAAVEE